MMFEKEVDFGLVRGLIPLIPGLIAMSIITPPEMNKELWYVGIYLIIPLFAITIQIFKYVVGSYIIHHSRASIKDEWFTRGLIGFTVLCLVYIPCISYSLMNWSGSPTQDPLTQMIFFINTATVLEENFILIPLMLIIPVIGFLPMIIPAFLLIGVVNEYIMAKITEKIMLKAGWL